ncbi:hypothetical protein [Clostridium sp. AM58-1XD]|uniref:hypothetical protein n=1 Tax=Clostridium sp. AM58-1XD TaxID=2292307 RepID=UPI0015F67126|nr:hypothetical protein [Clostridium sp. AM58-1XD]
MTRPQLPAGSRTIPATGSTTKAELPSPAGEKLTGNGTWYYFDENGVTAVNTTIGGYIIGPDGAWNENT